MDDYIIMIIHFTFTYTPGRVDGRLADHTTQLTLTVKEHDDTRVR